MHSPSPATDHAALAELLDKLASIKQSEIGLYMLDAKINMEEYGYDDIDKPKFCRKLLMYFLQISSLV